MLQIDDTIFTSTRSFSNELSENLNSLIEKHELSWAINSLKKDKATGVDKITPKMVLNTPNNWRTKLYYSGIYKRLEGYQRIGRMGR